MKRALVTGGTGFVGANLVQRLVRDGHEVHLLASKAHCPRRIQSIQKDIVRHTVDLRDAEGVRPVRRPTRDPNGSSI